MIEAERSVQKKRKSTKILKDKENQSEPTENLQDKMYVGWVPPELRRPEDEFFDLKSL